MNKKDPRGSGLFVRVNEISLIAHFMSSLHMRERYNYIIPNERGFQEIAKEI